MDIKNADSQPDSLAILATQRVEEYFRKSGKKEMSDRDTFELAFNEVFLQIQQDNEFKLALISALMSCDKRRFAFLYEELSHFSPILRSLYRNFIFGRPNSYFAHPLNLSSLLIDIFNENREMKKRFRRWIEEKMSQIKSGRIDEIQNERKTKLESVLEINT